MDVKQIIELAESSELAGMLIAYAGNVATKAAIDAAYLQGRSNAYGELVALLEGRVQFESDSDGTGNAGAGDAGTG